MSVDILRLPSQHRALHCYIGLSLWILLLIAGVYKFLEPAQKLPEPVATPELLNNLVVDVKTRKIFKLCNLPDEIGSGDEGVLEPSAWTLKGVLVLIRHGDRGPLQHVRNVTTVNCGGSPNELLHNYEVYLHNLTVSGKISWAGPGPFHGFPLLPADPNQCQLGQLTMQGVNQLLKLGSVLRSSYADVWPALRNLTHKEVAVFSTRYRRTFQSALAFLYGMLRSPEALAKVCVSESQSMNFCFRDCGCPVTEYYFRQVKKAISYQLKSHPAVAILSESTGRSIFSSAVEQGSLGSDPHAIRDALLTYVCHGSSLPCDSPYSCIKRQNVAGVFAYTDWVNYQKWRNAYWRKLCLLRSYGLIRHIVQQMLYMVSNGGPRLVLYSGHDHTIEQLSTALGLVNEPLLLRYAARVVLEVYRDSDNSQTGVGGVYFRVLSNGRDVTKQIGFCKSVVMPAPKTALCKIEDIIRFLHEDYFASLNVSNFKDACVTRSN